MEHSPARSPASSTDSVDGGRKSESLDRRCAGFRCDCGLTHAIRTSFTVQNMGFRFWCCPKKEDPCPYFHFLPSQQRIEGRALELILIFKERESKAINDKEKLKEEKVALMQDRGRIAEEKNKVLQENIKLVEENLQLKDHTAKLGRMVRALEKKIHKVEKKCRLEKMIRDFLCLLFAMMIVGLTGTITLKYFI